MAKQRLSRKILHICIVFVIIVVIIFVAMILILNYHEKGETNMPFQVSKISIISDIQGQDAENPDYKWNINVMQNNDIYIYIEKNENYKKQETIESVKIDNFNVIEKPSVGEIKMYKPTQNDKLLFENIDENVVEELEFIGAKETDIKKLQISNQGGVPSFRCAINNIGSYISNDETEINYSELLKKLNISEEYLSSKISFDITITLDSGKAFKAEDIILQIPNSNIVENGKEGKEYSVLDEIVFKRIEN